MDDYYAILGVPKTADQSEIKKAYREQALLYHPDHNPDVASAEERFKKIGEAYAVLSDPQKRAAYDSGAYSENASPVYGGYARSQAEDVFYTMYGNPFGWQYEEPKQSPQKPLNRKSALFLLIRSVLLAFIALACFPRLLFMGPVGIFIVIAAIVNGITGIIRGIQGLFKKTG